MPDVLVDSSSSSPHSTFPGIVLGSCLDVSATLDPSSIYCDLAPVSSQYFPSLDIPGSSPPSPSDRARDYAQRLLPKSNLGLALSGNVGDSGCEFPSELLGMPIPSPRKNFHSGVSSESMLGSPLFSDGNGVGSPVFPDTFSALHKFLPSNTKDDETWLSEAFPAMDAYSCDDFRMYEFKVRRCMRGRSHDWTECPFAHPGEKARRRDPRRIHYSGTACPDFRKGSCKRGDACEYAHGVFECWLHPARYRTQPCKDGRACRRRVCFFAHTVEQLRVLPSAVTATSSPSVGSPRKTAPIHDGSPLRLNATYDGPLMRQAFFTEGMKESISNRDEWEHNTTRLLQKVMESKGHGVYGIQSPTSTLYGYHTSSPPALSPPFSPSTSPPTSPEPYLCWARGVGSVQHHPQSPLSNTSPIPAHRRHLNRLQTMPTLSIPSTAVDHPAEATFDEFPSFSLPASIPSPQSATGVSELLHSLQSLQLRNRVADLQKASSTPSTPQNHSFSYAQNSLLRQYMSSSIPGTPKSDGLWDFSERITGMEPPMRVESGRDLRAKIYGKIGKENGVESNEDPDLGWVNELVK